MISVVFVVVSRVGCIGVTGVYGYICFCQYYVESNMEILRSDGIDSLLAHDPRHILKFENFLLIWYRSTDKSENDIK